MRTSNRISDCLIKSTVGPDEGSPGEPFTLEGKARETTFQFIEREGPVRRTDQRSVMRPMQQRNKHSKTGPEIDLYAGGVIDPFNPCSDQIRIEDIAHALSMLCRFNGHCRHFYSVAEHSVRVAERCRVNLQLDGLLHDAAEAYLGDLPRPIKQALPDFQSAERRLQAEISRKFDLSMEMPDEVRLADDEMLRIELTALIHPCEVSSPGTKQSLECWAPERAKAEFLEFYAELQNRKNAESFTITPSDHRRCTSKPGAVT